MSVLIKPYTTDWLLCVNYASWRAIPGKKAVSAVYANTTDILIIIDTYKVAAETLILHSIAGYVRSYK